MRLRRLASGGPWEEAVGYSRAVIAGPLVFVSGCSATVAGDVVGVGDPHLQALTALQVAEEALAEAGCTLHDVVRTRLYLRDLDHWAEVGRAHAGFFGESRPASTMVEVSRLIDDRLLVEVEVTAFRQAPPVPEAGAEPSPEPEPA